jgi:hypothetical protein
MQINPYLFILPRTPGLIVWDYKNHKQYELDIEHSTRLAELINKPNRFNNRNSIDIQLLEAEILTTATYPIIEWGWDDLSKIFHIGTKNIPCQHTPQDIHEWSREYLNHCNEVLATPTPDTRLAERSAGELITLPKPSCLPENLWQTR